MTITFLFYEYLFPHSSSSCVWASDKPWHMNMNFLVHDTQQVPMPSDNYRLANLHQPLSLPLSLFLFSALPLSPCPNMLFFMEQDEYDPFWQHWPPDLSVSPVGDCASWGVWLADALSPPVWITCRSWPLYSKSQSPSATCEHLQDLTWKAHSLLSDMALAFSNSYQVEGLPQNSSISSGKAYYFSQGKSETKTANSQTWKIVAWRT